MGTFGGLTPRTFAASTWTGAFPRVQGTYSTTGIVIPSGSLDTWWTFRRTKGAARGEVIGFGDSTMFGSGGLYSWLQRLRDRAVSYGFTDGGKGIVASLEDALLYDPPEVNDFVSGNLTGAPDAFDVLGGNVWYDNGSAPGHALGLQFRGTAARIWYSRRVSAGEFTYSVDGGAAVTVNAYLNNSSAIKFVYLSGLSSGLHTVTVTNRAGQTANPPSSLAVSGTATGGSLAAGTYYYVATYVFGGGETVQSPECAATVPASGLANLVLPYVGQDSMNLYRSSASGGPYLKVTTPTSSGPFSTTGQPQTMILGDTGAGTTATNPPGTGTTNLNTSAKGMYIALAGMNDTGFTTQKFAMSGQTVNTFNTSWPAYAALGLSYNGGSITDPASYTVDTSLPAAGRVKPVLAVWQLGFNDLSGQASTDYSLYTTGVQRFAAMCQAAGCSGMVLSGQLPYNASWPTYGAGIFAALKNQALSSGLAWADLFTPVAGPSLSYSGGTQNPHLTKTQYQAQADWLWDNILAAS